MTRPALMVAALLLPVAACASRRVRECKAVKAAVARAFPAASASADPPPAVLAERYAQLARAIRDIDADDPELRPELRDYAKNADAAARAADKLVQVSMSTDFSSRFPAVRSRSATPSVATASIPDRPLDGSRHPTSIMRRLDETMTPLCSGRFAKLDNRQLCASLAGRDYESQRSCHLSSQSAIRPSPRPHLERRPPGGGEPAFEHLGGGRAAERLVRPVLEVPTEGCVDLAPPLASTERLPHPPNSRRQVAQH